MAATRTQYPFTASWYKYKTPAEISVLRRQWNMFETVENCDFQVLQQRNAGYLAVRWYAFLQSSDLVDYNRGKTLHQAQYPGVNFTPQRELFVQPSTIYTTIGYESSQPSNGILFSTAITESERIRRNGDMSMYMQVSTFNATHVYKWVFGSEEERMAYDRIAREQRS
jgi:hypothetical protein